MKIAKRKRGVGRKLADNIYEKMTILCVAILIHFDDWFAGKLSMLPCSRSSVKFCTRGVIVFGQQANTVVPLNSVHSTMRREKIFRYKLRAQARVHNFFGLFNCGKNIVYFQFVHQGTRRNYYVRSRIMRLFFFHYHFAKLGIRITRFFGINAKWMFKICAQSLLAEYYGDAGVFIYFTPRI